MEVNTATTVNPINTNNEFSNLIFNPVVILIVFFIIILYFSFSNSLGNNDGFVFGDTSESNNSILMNIVTFIIIIILIILFFQYILKINLSAKIYDIYTNTPKVDINIDHINGSSTSSSSGSSTSSDYLDSNGNYQPLLLDGLSLKHKKQVFNIPGNKYDYNSAKALCKAYNSDLATYNQVEDIYKNGGEWCNYGWSEGQMALFPTQQTTFNNLQKIEGHEHDCGRPGINGGYIANPSVKFGVNCYGVKPLITQEESDLMKTMTPYPETEKDKLFQKQVNTWKSKINEILVSPFNYKSWTQV